MLNYRLILIFLTFLKEKGFIISGFWSKVRIRSMAQTMQGREHLFSPPSSVFRSAKGNIQQGQPIQDGVVDSDAQQGCT